MVITKPTTLYQSTTIYCYKSKPYSSLDCDICLTMYDDFLSEMARLENPMMIP